MSQKINLQIEKTKNLNLDVKNTKNIDLEISRAGGGSGTSNYNALINKPAINDVTLIGNKTFEELGVQTMTNLEIKEVFDKVFSKGGD